MLRRAAQASGRLVRPFMPQRVVMLFLNGRRRGNLTMIIVAQTEAAAAERSYPFTCLPFTVCCLLFSYSIITVPAFGEPRPVQGGNIDPLA